jgi:hypothetical protein
MSLYTTNKITEDFLLNLIDAPALPKILIRTARTDRISLAFENIGQKTGWENIELSGYYETNQYALAFRVLNKGDYIITYNKGNDENYNSIINVVAIDKLTFKY